MLPKQRIIDLRCKNVKNGENKRRIGGIPSIKDHRSGYVPFILTGDPPSSSVPKLDWEDCGPRTSRLTVRKRT